MLLNDIDDIAGMYQCNTISQHVNIRYLLIDPIDGPDRTIAQVVMRTENAVETQPITVKFAFDNGVVTANFSTDTFDVHGEGVELQAAITLQDSPGILLLSGQLEERVNSTMTPSIPIHGLMKHPALVPSELEAFKAEFADDPEIQSVTFGDLLSNSCSIEDDGYNAQLDPERSAEPIPRTRDITSCVTAVASVVIDCVLLASGTVALKTVLGSTTGALSRVARLVANAGLSTFEAVIIAFRTTANLWEKAKIVWQMIKTLSTFGILKKTIGAVAKSLRFWDWIFFGIMVIATIFAAFATGGVAIIAQVVLLLTAVATLGSDLAKLFDNCSAGKDAVPA